MEKTEAQQIIKFLNELLMIDRQAISELFSFRAECNEAMDNHPAAITTVKGVGVLGILNGMCGRDENGNGYIWAVYNDADPDTIMNFNFGPPGKITEVACKL
jgi:hypothetical protein